jgi:hypothetical protein
MPTALSVPWLTRQRVLLAALFGMLGVIAYVEWAPPPAAHTLTTAALRRPGASSPPETSAPPPDIHLSSLDAEHPAPDVDRRNLFAFATRSTSPSAFVPASASVPVRDLAPPPSVPSGPPPPPPLPPIALKFIGVVTGETTSPIAILSDGRGAPIYGKAGESVLGQYKILRIDAESIEMAYIDGRGRQTIRLSGS